MKKTFPQSRDLKRIIENHDWTLYDVSNVPKDRAFSLEELEEEKPAEEYSIGNNYLFVPIPKNGETLRKAYSLTKGVRLTEVEALSRGEKISTEANYSTLVEGEADSEVIGELLWNARRKRALDKKVSDGIEGLLESVKPKEDPKRIAQWENFKRAQGDETK